MTLELLLATVMVLATVAIHGLGLLAISALLGTHRLSQSAPGGGLLSTTNAMAAVTIVLGLFVLHGLEIWVYAVVFRLVGAIDDLREAVYFSTISYGAIGYGDSEVRPDWKLLGAIEGINGSILLGWSVAFFVTAMSRLNQRRRRRG